VEVLQAVTDPRDGRGTIYSVSALLSLCIAGLLCGCQTYGAIAQWGAECDLELARQLGFAVTPKRAKGKGNKGNAKERRPGPGVLFYLLHAIDWEELERILGAWAQEVMAGAPRAEGAVEGIAIDGKTLRGTAKQVRTGCNAAAAKETDARSGKAPVLAGRQVQTGPGAHLLSAFSHRLSLTLGQRAVPDKTNEIIAVHELLEALFLQGRVVTVDALLTQRAIATAILKKKGTT
jgi:hypothetical protein